MDDLATAMGINRPSMYGAFGDKESIFMKAMERYVVTTASQPNGPLTAPKVRDAVRAFLQGVLEYSTSGSGHCGCLIGSVAPVVDNPKVRDFVVATVTSATDQLTARMEAGIKAGELPANFPVRQRARRATNAMVALSSRARQGAPKPELAEDVEDAVTTVFGPV